jgi:HD superfamily phosphohydrolase
MHKLNLTNINTKYKVIYDVIHGYINISDIACDIIDTVEFQRLRDIRQLGVCFYVFPSAMHSRFEHSIGTYHLTGRILNRIKESTPKADMHNYLSNIPELKHYFDIYYIGKMYELDDYLCELIKIGGLCHDLGHMAFSHLFDILLERQSDKLKNPAPEINHEYRSGMLLEHIIRNNKKLRGIISDLDIHFVKTLIDPNDENTSFVYQIISNQLNSLDVDKYDYIIRDSHMIGFGHTVNFSRLVDEILVLDNKICYLVKLYAEISGLFETRYKLHKQVYCHQAVISFQLMILEIMTLLNPILKITESINKVSEFIKFTDSYILASVQLLFDHMYEYPEKYWEAIAEAKILYDQIKIRDNYKLITTYVFDSDTDFSIVDVPVSDISDVVDKSKLIIFECKIGFVSGNKQNPLDHIWMFEPKKNNKLSLIDKKNMSKLLPNEYQEKIIMLFDKS